MGTDLAGRLAVDYSARDTFIDYTNPNFQKGKTDHDFSALTTRAKLLWLPTDIQGWRPSSPSRTTRATAPPRKPPRRRTTSSITPPRPCPAGSRAPTPACWT
ncbi:hypothetical protein NWF32_24255 [Pseudomonas qingdaonensis]|nr:hypothetical protein [Pseudomonas qingdaonensis]